MESDIALQNVNTLNQYVDGLSIEAEYKQLLLTAAKGFVENRRMGLQLIDITEPKEKDEFLDLRYEQMQSVKDVERQLQQKGVSVNFLAHAQELAMAPLKEEIIGGLVDARVDNINLTHRFYDEPEVESKEGLLVNVFESHDRYKNLQRKATYLGVTQEEIRERENESLEPFRKSIVDEALEIKSLTDPASVNRLKILKIRLKRLGALEDQLKSLE